MTALADKLATLRRKQGYSQQQVADLLGVSRQTISNWELGQGAPALDKATELARVLHVGLSDLACDEVEVLAASVPPSAPDLHVLERLKGCTCRLTCVDDEWTTGPAANAAVRVLDVNADWMRVSYERTKPGSLSQKETVVQLLDVDAIACFVVEGPAQSARPAGLAEPVPTADRGERA